MKRTLALIFVMLLIYAAWAACARFLVGVTLDRADLFVLSCAAVGAAWWFLDDRP